MIDPTRKLTPQEAAERIGLSESHLAKLRMSGDGPAFFKLGRKIMYALGDVDAWLASRRLTKAPTKGWKGGRRKQAGGTEPQSAAA